MSDNNATVRVHFLPDDNSLAKLQKALAKAMDVSKIGKGLQIKADPGALKKMTDEVQKALNKAVAKPIKPIIKPKVDPSFTNSLQNAMAGLSRAVSGMGAIAMGRGLAGGTMNFIKDLTEAGFEIEKTQLSLENLFGSAEMGQGVMQELMQLATKMPGSVLDLLPAYRQLIPLGLTPSKDEMYALGEISTLTGKKITDTAMAIQMAGGGTYKRLRSMGIEVKKNGDQLTMTYLGVSKTIGTSKKAIYDYMVELGKMPGVQGAMAKQMDTLAGQTQNTADQFAILKYSLYLLLEKAFLPLVKWITKVVAKISDWVAENPALAKALLVIVIVISFLIAGILLALGAIILISMAMSAWATVSAALAGALLPLIWEIVLIGIVVLAVIAIFVLLYVYWDEICLWLQLAWYGVVEAFWNGIYGISIAFLEFLNWVYDNFGPFAEFFVEVALFILSAFTMNIPGIAGAFALMADGAATAIMALEKFCLQVASSIAGGFAKTFNYITTEGKKLKASADEMGIGWMVDGIAILSGASGMAYFNGNDAGKVAQQASTNWSSQANAVQKQIDSKTAEQKARNNAAIDKFKQDRDAKTTELKNMSQGAKDSYDRKAEVKEAKKEKAQEDFMSQVKEKMAELTGAKEMLDENGNPIDEGADKGKGGGGKDKGGGSKKVGDGKDTAIDKASVTAISGIQKVLRDMGYSLESEIRRADLFKAQREALKAIEAERQRKNLSPIISLYNTITNRPEKSSGSTQNVNININAHGVNKDTKLKDLLKMADKR